MAKNANLHIRVEEDIKAKAEKLFSGFGITITDAVNIFLYKSIMEGGLPFEVRTSVPNADTLAAMREVDDMISGKAPQKQQSVNSLFKELDIHVDN